MKRSALTGLVLLLALAAPPGLSAQIALDDAERLRLSGDFRLRFESDWDSARADGSERSDRNRLRIRARVVLSYDPTEAVSFGFRLRTGETEAQQSPHLTIILQRAQQTFGEALGIRCREDRPCAVKNLVVDQRVARDDRLTRVEV